MNRDYVQEMRETYDQATQALDPNKKKVTFSVCPTTSKKPCKLCDLCKEILWHKDKYSPDLVERARDINRKDKFYANIILPTNPSEVVVFEYGIVIGSKLVTMEMDDTSDLKGFMNPNQGRNMYIIKYPNPNKQKTKYDVEPRIAVTSLPDMSVLNRMYDLDNILQLMKEGKVQPLYQSKLGDGKTEMRFLPSWLGPKFANVFQVRLRFHYRVSTEELEAIERGEFDPFSLSQKESKQTEIPAEIKATPDGWGTIKPPGSASFPASGLYETSPGHFSNEPPPPTGPGKVGIKPVCCGTYDADEEECNINCRDDGWMEECKKDTEAAMSKRRQARGLYR